MGPPVLKYNQVSGSLPGQISPSRQHYYYLKRRASWNSNDHSIKLTQAPGVCCGLIEPPD